MAVGLKSPGNLLVVEGISLSACSAGIYVNKKRNDMTLLQLQEGTTVAAVFTRNRFCAAPVTVARQHLDETNPRYLLINAGNANAGTGEQGINDARTLCNRLADMCGCGGNEVLPFSTGVIGEYLPLEKMGAALEPLVKGLSANNWLTVAEAIMTTDTIAKASSLRCEVGGKTVTFTGITKGSGMIKPNMATMLAYVATDASVEKAILQQALNEAVNQSFNRITVDGDTSTNDACVLMATGAAGNKTICSTDGEDYRAFVTALVSLCSELAQAIVRDGEGATKFVTINVRNGASQPDCLAIAYQIAHSPLVKTALTASDANWGRILAAVGNANASNIDINTLTLWLDDVCIVENGQRAAGYTEARGKAVMARAEIAVVVDLNVGNAEETVWTTDLSHEYIKINAEYRT